MPVSPRHARTRRGARRPPPQGLPALRVQLAESRTAMGILDTLLEGRRTRKAARLLYAGAPDAEEALSRLRPQSRRQALVDVAREWRREERDDEAAALLERVLGEEGNDLPALRLKAELQADVDPEGAAQTLQRLVTLVPGIDASLILQLAEALISADRPEEALERLEPLRKGAGPEVLLRVGKALYAASRTEEALEVLDGAMDQADALARFDPFAGDVTQGDPVFAELRALHEEVLAEVHGREAVTLDAALRRKLDARAGVNFKLLAQSLMHQRTGKPRTLLLESTEQERASGHALLSHDAREVMGHLFLGSADLREGLFEEALHHFEEAERSDPKHFAAVLGRGAALQAREQGADALASRRLPRGRGPIGLAQRGSGPGAAHPPRAADGAGIGPAPSRPVAKAGGGRGTHPNPAPRHAGNGCPRVRR